MKITKVLVIKGYAQYGALGYNCDEIVKGFCSGGCLVSILDLTSTSAPEWNKEQLTGYDMIFTFNAIVPDFDVFHQEKTNELLWTFLVDHPLSQHQRLVNMTGNTMVSCVDRRHVSYIDRFYPNIAYTCFLPHGGVIGDVWNRIFQERQYSVVFLGGLKDINEIIEGISGLERKMGVLLKTVMDRIENDVYSDLEVVIEEEIQKSGGEIDDEQLAAINHLFFPMDLYRRYLKRRRLIETLGNAGITVDIWGKGWEKIAEKNNPFLRFHESMEYESVKHIMSDAKIVINDMPFFQDGSHERVFTSMQCGAVCVTERNCFIEECFSDLENIVLYEAGKIEEVPDILRALLADPERMQRIAQNGIFASQLHTWKERALDILEIAKDLQ